jgi:arylsulfatase A-like enzyme
VNVVWIVIDCLRADRLGCYGYERPTTPNLDRVAREAARFTQCISPHIPTQPAHTSFFASKDVFTHQIVAQGGKKEPEPGLRLLPQILRERDYFTAAVDNIGRWIEPAFEQYEIYPRWNHDGSKPWRNGEQVTERALRLIEQHDGRRPFFYFFHYWDPHTPYLPPVPFDRMFYSGDEKDPRHHSMEPVWQSPWFTHYFEEWLPGVTDLEYVRAQYDASVAYSDACVGRLLQALERRGMLEDTLLVIGSDHGEELDEHGMWFDHHGLYDTNLRVPLILWSPGRIPCGTRIEGQVNLIDVAPTLLELAGMPELPAAEEMQGRSLLPLIEATGDRRQATARPGQEGEAVAETGAAGTVGCRLSPGASLGTWEALYCTECTWMRKRAWRTPEWKLIRALEEDIYGNPRTELYDLKADPGERHNLAESRPEVARALGEEMDGWVRQRLAATGLPDPIEAQADALRIWQPRFIAGHPQWKKVLLKGRNALLGA